MSLPVNVKRAEGLEEGDWGFVFCRYLNQVLSLRQDGEGRKNGHKQTISRMAPKDRIDVFVVTSRKP